MIELADGVAGIPELRGDAAVAWILQHADFLSALNLPTNLGRKLKLVTAVVDGPGTIRLHEDSLACISEEIVVIPGAGEQADVGHANDGQSVPAFGAHGSGRAVQADQVRGFTIRKIAAEFAGFDDVGALRGNTLVVVSKSAQALAVIKPRVSDDVHDARSVLKFVQLIESQKTRARKIGFLPEDTVQFDGMSNRFVDLESQLAGAQDERADFFRALRGRMECGGFFGDDGSISHQIERIDEFVALESMLAAKTIRIRTLLNFLALKRSGGNAAAGNHLALMNTRADAGSEPGIDLTELHVRFREGDAFNAAHFGVGTQQQGELRFKRDFERVFTERALPTVHVGLLRRKNHFAPFRERRSFRYGNGVRRTSGDAILRQAIRGSKTPGTVGQHANAEANRFAL